MQPTNMLYSGIDAVINIVHGLFAVTYPELPEYPQKINQFILEYCVAEPSHWLSRGQALSAAGLPGTLTLSSLHLLCDSL